MKNPPPYTCAKADDLRPPLFFQMRIPENSIPPHFDLSGLIVICNFAANENF
jgi:hypothetical protein